MSKVVAGMSWKEAFIGTLPKRKIFSAKDEVNSLDSENNSHSDEQEENKCPIVEKNKCLVAEDNKCQTIEENIA